MGIFFWKGSVWGEVLRIELNISRGRSENPVLQLILQCKNNRDGFCNAFRTDKFKSPKKNIKEIPFEEKIFSCFMSQN